MKRQILTLVGVLSLLLAAGSAFAQDMTVKADVPFTFMVDKATLAPGQYTLQTLDSSYVVLIRASDRKTVAIAIDGRIESLAPAGQTRLVFQRYGDSYFLSQIWVAGDNSGHQLHKSARESELARNSKPQAEIVAALTIH
jgi:hypothetical protein